jgi:hypothetical protein
MLVMGIDAAPQEVTFAERGHVLRFRLDDSVDPEYYPPPQVRLWLCVSYGIRVSSKPLTATQRRQMKRYWYLDVLRREPPNPAKSALYNEGCVPEGIDLSRPPTVNRAPNPFP